MKEDEVVVEYVGDRYDTDRPWVVHGGRTPGSMSTHQTKSAATSAAESLASRYQKLLVVKSKSGSVSRRKDYRQQRRDSFDPPEAGGGFFRNF